MGQYWKPVNLDKREFVNPHKLGSGLKLWEQLANAPGVGAALTVLTAACQERRGGGDFDIEENWHGPERKAPGEHNLSPGPMPDSYPEIAKRTIGRWAGDRIAIVGDYAEDGDLPNSPVPASEIYGLCHSPEYGDFDGKGEPFKDISDDVCRVIEHELNGKFEGDGWRTWKDGA